MQIWHVINHCYFLVCVKRRSVKSCRGIVNSCSPDKITLFSCPFWSSLELYEFHFYSSSSCWFNQHQTQITMWGGSNWSRINLNGTGLDALNEPLSSHQWSTQKAAFKGMSKCISGDEHHCLAFFLPLLVWSTGPQEEWRAWATGPSPAWADNFSSFLPSLEAFSKPRQRRRCHYRRGLPSEDLHTTCTLTWFFEHNVKTATRYRAIYLASCTPNA